MGTISGAITIASYSPPVTHLVAQSVAPFGGRSL
jgi:hypothetical protein